MRTRGRSISGECLERTGDQETFQSSGLLSLSTETHSRARVLLNLRLLAATSSENGRNEARHGTRELRAKVVGGRENTFDFRLPEAERTLVLGLFAEDETEEHVHAADSEEEEGSDESEVVDVVGEDSGTDEALEDTQCAETEVAAEYREVTVEEAGGPPEFGENESDDLEDDEQAVDNGPEYSCRLVWNGAILDVIAVSHVGITGIFHKMVDGLNIRHEHEDAACKHQNHGDDAQGPDGVESDEEISTRGKRHRYESALE